jgi:CRP/FNR family cyclic AMP-dependent transcriptional regulator
LRNNIDNPSGTRSASKGETTALQAVENVIADHPFLRHLKPRHLRVLTDNAMRMHYEEGQLIFREGEPANRFYMIEQGHVSLESYRPDELSLAIQKIGPGEVLGWSWLFQPCYWHFDARILEPTTATFLYGARLRELCEEDHDLGYELMKRMTQVVIQRLQATRMELLACRVKSIPGGDPDVGSRG